MLFAGKDISGNHRPADISAQVDMRPILLELAASK
jgi:hypothetical protein